MLHIPTFGARVSQRDKDWKMSISCFTITGTFVTYVWFWKTLEITSRKKLSSNPRLSLVLSREVGLFRFPDISAGWGCVMQNANWWNTLVSTSFTSHFVQEDTPPYIISLIWIYFPELWRVVEMQTTQITRSWNLCPTRQKILSPREVGPQVKTLFTCRIEN